MLAHDHFFKRRQVYDKLKDRFYVLFQEPLSNYMDVNSAMGLTCGFDITRFDKEITQARPGESVKDVLLRQWGKKAVAVVEELVRS